ncbi:MAG: single-stranded DNA-binding protein [Gammaproteobacteria bacterium]|nr:single-stranded DNA-binding protein [Gammaproteobacteria bacterium]
MFGLNLAQVIGRLGADVTINHLPSGGRVANMSVATDESYINRETGARVDQTEWHRVVTFQPGLIDMLEKHARKGRLVYLSGKMQTRPWRRDGEDTDRFTTEILLAPGGRIQFLEKPRTANGSNGSDAPTAQAEAPEATGTAQDLNDDIPF